MSGVKCSDIVMGPELALAKYLGSLRFWAAEVRKFGVPWR